MVTTYEMGCECGKKFRVQARQAGETLACECGRSIEVPTLRGLAQLPQLQQAETAGRRWTRMQGVCFLAGIAWMAMGGMATWQLASRAARPVEIQTFDRVADEFSARVDRLTPSESFTYWRMFRDQPRAVLTSGQRIEAAGRGNSQYVWLAWVSGAATPLGLVIMGFGLWAGRQSVSS